jgi:hypothetical protein
MDRINRLKVKRLGLNIILHILSILLILPLRVLLPFVCTYIVKIQVICN